jgi:hypothetical protein
MQTNRANGKIHLVGSIGLDTVDEVFRTVGRMLGQWLRRVPDGEPGGRRLWISFQYPALRASPFLRPDPNGAIRKTTGFPLLCLAEGVGGTDVRFGELNYAREARASYLDFCAVRERGDLPADIRFQVCLPTAMGVTRAFCTTRDLASIESAYETAIIREVESICAAIPNDDLCIQWDFCTEMIMWDGQPQDQFPPASRSDIVGQIARICQPIPERVEIGLHLCYGDFAAKHFLEPTDAGKMVEVANAVTRAVHRPLAYFHMPVPIARCDDAYFKPLCDLKIPPGSELYLGVVHAADGVAGTCKRIAAARAYTEGFGIATECGMARARTPDVVRHLLKVHAEVAQVLAQSE